MSGRSHGAVETRDQTNPSALLTEQRPWGSFMRFTHNETSTVKVITVQPGQRLSLQRHAQRDELWHVLDEGVVVEVDGRAWRPVAGEQVWVPKQSLHRMSSDAPSPVRVLEVAFGQFDEDDIERVEDDHGRLS